MGDIPWLCWTTARLSSSCQTSRSFNSSFPSMEPLPSRSWQRIPVVSTLGDAPSIGWYVPGLVNIQIAIENGNLWWIFPLKMVIFHSYVTVYQRVDDMYLLYPWKNMVIWPCLMTPDAEFEDHRIWPPAMELKMGDTVFDTCLVVSIKGLFQPFPARFWWAVHHQPYKIAASLPKQQAKDTIFWKDSVYRCNLSDANRGHHSTSKDGIPSGYVKIAIENHHL